MNKLFPQWKKRVLIAGAVALLTTGAAASAQANDVVALKNALYGAGYDIDNVSASMDPSTRSALKAFQKDNSDLKASGELDDATKQALGIISVDAGASQTVASQKASAPASARKAAAPVKQEVQKKAKEEKEDDGWSLW